MAAKKKPQIPQYILKKDGLTPREWRAKKRRELRAMIKAFEEYRMGCAFCPPCDKAVGTIQDALDRLKAALSSKVWR